MKQYYHCTKLDPKYNSMTLPIHTTCFTQDEIDVANILLDLPNLISLSEDIQRGQVPLRWVVKKKRSVPSVRVVEEDNRIRPQLSAKVESTSPSTPLTFYPSESDDKSNHRPLNNFNLKKRTREELMEEIDGLTQTRKLLTMEVDNERRRLKKLKSLNSALKENKSEAISSGLGIIGNGSLNVELKLEQQYHPNLVFANQQQQLIINHSICESSQAASARLQFPNNGQVPQFLSSNGGDGLSFNQGGPLGIPDLNIGLEEAYGLESFQPLDHSRVLVDDDILMCAAEARRRRMNKIKERRKKQQHQRVR